MARSGNPNPVAARQARKSRPKPGTIKQLQSVIWSAITKLEGALEPPVVNGALSPEGSQKDFAIQVGELTRLTHALSQAGATYLKAVEVGDLEARLAALEAAQGKDDDEF